MKKVISIFGTILFVSTILTSCGPSACDCANLRNDSPMKKKYTPQQLNDSDFLRRESDKHVKKAKKCAELYGNLDDIEKELARTVKGINWIPKLDEAIRNAKKECYKNKSYSKQELEIACDCWNQSVKKSGKAYDNMSESEQKLRMKCFEIFSEEDVMKDACERVPKNN